MVSTWIFQQNLECFLEMLTFIAGYPFDDWDYDAIAHGIEGTDSEKENGFDYEFQGTKRLVKFRIADDPGSSVYLVQLEAPEDAVELVELAYLVSQGYDTKRHPSFGK